MNRVRVNKAEIMAKIQANRDIHRSIYERAMEGYRKKAVARLNSVIDDLKAGKTPNLHIGLRIPEDHTTDYDVILDMLANSIDSYVELDEIGFRRYVRDEWDWKQNFTALTMDYLEQ
jgi:hypothetical protein